MDEVIQIDNNTFEVPDNDSKNYKSDLGQKCVISVKSVSGAASESHSGKKLPSFTVTNPENISFADLKDSMLAKLMAQGLANILVLDEISFEWHENEKGIWRPITKTRSVKIINHLLGSLLIEGYSISKLNAIECFLKIYLSSGGWEKNKTLLPVSNGILNTQTMTVEDYTSKHRFNWQLPYPYEPDAQMPTIKRWLWWATGQDMQAINIIRAFFKVALTGGELQKFLEVVGQGGTGKSTLARLMIMLIGESNCVSTDLKNLEGNRFESAGLYGKRAAIISDSSRYGGEVNVLKAITGGDPVRYEKKNQQQSEFLFDGVVLIASNEPIQSSDYTSGLARRRLPLLFKTKITDADKQKWRSAGGIEKAMHKELPGLLNWVLAMTDDEVIDSICSISGDMTPAEREHLIATNKIAEWIDENLYLDENSTLYIGKAPNDKSDLEQAAREKLYPNYLLWCSECGINPIALRRFSSSITDVSEHCHLPIKLLDKDSKGRPIQGFNIRREYNGSHPTPITLTQLNLVYDSK